MIQSLGSGIARIRNICAEYGVIEPTFEEITQGFQVVLFKEKIEKSEFVHVNDTLNDTLNERQKFILLLIKQNEKITNNIIANELKISTETSKREMAKLVRKNLIQHVGSRKNGYWKIIEK